MPEKAIRAFQDHGRVAATLEQGVDASELLLRRLATAGVDYDDVVATLERDGIETFIDSFEQLLQRLRTRAPRGLVDSRI